MFLLVPADPGGPGQRAKKRSLLLFYATSGKNYNKSSFNRIEYLRKTTVD